MRENNKTKSVIFLISLAYLFALFFRFFLYFLAKKHPEFQFGGHIISIWTADAGLHASIAKNLLTHSSNIPHYITDRMLGEIIYVLTKYLHIPLDVSIFMLPAFFASLIVIPLVLIFYEFGLLRVGFWSALAASIGMNYYFRTHLGYTDTDILNFPLFFMIAYTMIAMLKRKNLLFSGLGAIFMLFFHFYYHSAKPLTFGLVIFFALYILLFARKEQLYYYALVIYLLPIVPISPLFIVITILFITSFLIFVNKKVHISSQWLLVFALVLFVSAGFVAYQKGYLQRAATYLQKQEKTFKDKSGKTIALQSTLKTVAEAKGITWRQLVTYSSGSLFIFLLGSLGLFLLVWNHREVFILLLPYIIGLISLKAGVRFTTFAVPVIVAGFIYIFFLLYRKVEKRKFADVIFYGAAAFIVAFYLHIMDAYNHLLSPFFNAGQVKAITTHLNTKEKGYILTWWDYGWPLWYYSNKRTVIDNGKHHYDNYIVAKTLFSSDQEFIANFNRFFIEKFDKIFPWSVFPYVAKNYELNKILNNLHKTNPQLPPKKNEIYYYFDDKIITKLPVIENFAYFENEKKEGFVWIDKLHLFNTQKGIVQGEKIQIDLQRGILYLGKKKDFIGKIYFSDGVAIRNTLFYRPNNYAIIVYKNRFIIGAYRYINSFFFQAFFFNNLDKKLFKTLSFTQDAKIFQLIGR
ncbi:STT3 domain-containing protein [Nitratiruptor sp. YY08-26]|uniref:STT3 domain-containing protein n=2 Tax=unclassified Nitratiruptor TaxID=2624044 RepID=UPI001916982E|nr:STT3 domain-containing protein [Nitratiruptor sp. YY08-26]